MKISIIVPAFNEEQFLGNTLARIKAAAGALATTGWEIELIVCDNNSTDRTAEIARAAGANVVFEPVNQISRARNSGAAAATGDWLVFVDADSHPGAGLFTDMAKEIQSGNCIAGGATIRWDQKLFIIELLTPLVNLGCRWRRMLSGAFIFIETAAFRNLGGFSNEAFGAEDVELAGRLKHLAGTTGKRFVILHRHPVTTSSRRMRLYTAHQQIGQFRLHKSDCCITSSSIHTTRPKTAKPLVSGMTVEDGNAA
jgi:cellulose synthase/poly-beta-1,6-N-acetylglucosamine synthase-like glycosyltransferase